MSVSQEPGPHRPPTTQPQQTFAVNEPPAWDQGGAQDQSGLLDYLMVLRRHFWLLVLMVGGALALGLLVAFLQPRMYAGELTLQIQANPPEYVPSVKDVKSPADSDTFYTTQLGILRSRAVAQRVAERLDVAEQRTLVETPGMFAMLLRRVGMASPPTESGASEPPSTRAVVNAIRSNLSVFRHKDSELVEVRFDASDPDLAARVANLMGDAYRAAEASERTEVSEQVRNWLTDQLQTLRTDLAQSEKTVQEYKQEHDLLDTGNMENLSSNRISGTSEELLNARAERRRAEVRYEQVKEADDVESLVAVLNNPVIQQLKMRQSQLQAEVDRLSTHYGANAPKMQEARAELQSVTQRLQMEVDRAVASIREEYQQAKQTENSLEQAQKEVSEGVRDDSDEALELAKLEREVETNRELYEAFRDRIKEIGVAGGMGATGIRVVDEATPPRAPFQPSYTRVLGIAGVLSLAGGIGLAFLMENLRRTFHTPQAFEGRYQLRGLGVVPKVAPERHSTLNRLAILDPDSEFTESVGAIRARLQLGPGEGGPRVIMVTSAIQGEGKTTLSSNLASSFAQLENTLLIDADLRRASLSSNWHGPGLTDFVMTGAELNGCLGRDNLSPGLFVMGKGRTPANPLEFFALRQFGEALATLRSRFDRIIIDTAPVLSVSDVEMMGHLTDGAVLAVRAGKTRTDAVSEALRRLHTARIPVFGVTLTQASMKEVARYGGYSYGYRASS